MLSALQVFRGVYSYFRDFKCIVNSGFVAPSTDGEAKQHWRDGEMNLMPKARHSRCPSSYKFVSGAAVSSALGAFTQVLRTYNSHHLHSDSPLPSCGSPAHRVM